MLHYDVVHNMYALPHVVRLRCDETTCVTR